MMKIRYCIVIYILIIFSMNTYSISNTELQGFCDELNKEFEGTIIVMETRTGLVNAITNPEFAVSELIEPGSLIKPILGLIALKYLVITPENKVFCDYIYEYHGERFLCSWADGHGAVELEKALAISCNYYFYNLAELLGDKLILTGLTELGLNKKTGTDFPGEVNVTIPEFLIEGELIKMGIGLNKDFKLTPVKIIQVMNIIPSEGDLVVPVKNESEISVKDLKLDKTDINIIKNGMIRCVSEGTARGLNFEEIPAGGKTGTSPITNSQKRDNWAMFFGFYPADNPQISILIIHRGGYASVDAVPIARKVILKIK